MHEYVIVFMLLPYDSLHYAYLNMETNAMLFNLDHYSLYGVVNL